MDMEGETLLKSAKSHVPMKQLVIKTLNPSSYAGDRAYIAKCDSCAGRGSQKPLCPEARPVSAPALAVAPPRGDVSGASPLLTDRLGRQMSRGAGLPEGMPKAIQIS